jgi:hypothetical protein
LFFLPPNIKNCKKRENLLGKNTFHTEKSTFLFPKFSLKISQSNENSPQKNNEGTKTRTITMVAICDIFVNSIQINRWRQHTKHPNEIQMKQTKTKSPHTPSWLTRNRFP